MAESGHAAEVKYIDELQQWLERNGPRYREGKAKLEDKEFFKKFLMSTLPVAVVDIMEFDVDKHGANGAIARISQAQLRLTWMMADVTFLETYEEKRQILSENLERLEKTGDPQEGTGEGEQHGQTGQI